MKRLRQTLHNALRLSTTNPEALLHEYIAYHDEIIAASLFRGPDFLTKREKELIAGIAATVMLYKGPDDKQSRRLLRSNRATISPLARLACGEPVGKENWPVLDVPIVKEIDGRYYPEQLLCDLAGETDTESHLYSPTLHERMGDIVFTGFGRFLIPEHMRLYPVDDASGSC